MLRSRVLTALLIGFPTLCLTLLASYPILFGYYFFWLVGAAIEWAQLLFGQPWQKWSYIALITAMMGLTYWWPSQLWLLVSVAWWLMALGIIISYRSEFIRSVHQFMCLQGIVALPATMIAITTIFEHENGRYWLLYGLSLVWAMDTGSYFVGRYGGTQPFFSHISPHKTWEGLLGGLGLTLIWGISIGHSLAIANSRLGQWLIVLAGLAVFSVTGDLFESLMKRQARVKDSGDCLPGHGGVLDRIDGILAMLPAFAISILWLDRLGF